MYPTVYSTRATDHAAQTAAAKRGYLAPTMSVAATTCGSHSSVFWCAPAGARERASSAAAGGLTLGAVEDVRLLRGGGFGFFCVDCRGYVRMGGVGERGHARCG